MFKNKINGVLNDEFERDLPFKIRLFRNQVIWLKASNTMVNHT